MAQVERQVKDLHSRLDSLNGNMNKILFYLHNDEDTGEKGLIAEVREMGETLKNFITDTKNKDALRAQKAGFFGSVFGFIGGIAISAFKWLLDWYKGDGG